MKTNEDFKDGLTATLAELFVQFVREAKPDYKEVYLGDGLEFNKALDDYKQSLIDAVKGSHE